MNQHGLHVNLISNFICLYHAYVYILRGFIPWQRKRLSIRRRKRLGLSSDGVVKKTINKQGRKTV